MLKALVANQASQMNAMQNRLISMERAHASHAPREYPPKPQWQRKATLQDHRPPNPLETANIVLEEGSPYCRSCTKFHDESTC